MRDISDLFSLSTEEEELVREILLIRGVNKWLYARRLFIDLKHQIKDYIKENNGKGDRRVLLRVYEKMQNIARTPRWVLFPKENDLGKAHHKIRVLPLKSNWLQSVYKPLRRSKK